MYIIKGVNKKLQGYGGFQYPWRGFISDLENWTEKPGCETGGIFGIDEKNFNYNIKNDVYLIIKYDHKKYIAFDGKCKIAFGKVVFLSKKIEKIQKYLEKRNVIYRGYGSTLTGGDRSTLTGGDRSTLTGGYGSTLTGGYGSTLTGGDCSTLTGGDRSILQWKYFDGNRNRIHILYIGENNIKSNTKYIGYFKDNKFFIDKYKEK